MSETSYHVQFWRIETRTWAKTTYRVHWVVAVGTSRSRSRSRRAPTHSAPSPWPPRLEAKLVRARWRQRARLRACPWGWQPDGSSETCVAHLPPGRVASARPYRLRPRERQEYFAHAATSRLTTSRAVSVVALVPIFEKCFTIGRLDEFCSPLAAGRSRSTSPGRRPRLAPSTVGFQDSLAAAIARRSASTDGAGPARPASSR
jgi:hypothetical protein